MLVARALRSAAAATACSSLPLLPLQTSGVHCPRVTARSSMPTRGRLKVGVVLYANSPYTPEYTLVSINRTLVERGFAQWVESY